MNAYGNTLDEQADRELARVTKLAHPERVPTPAFAPVDFSNLMSQNWPAARHVFEPIIPRRVVTLLAGHGGIGKSMLGLILAAHAACGRQWGPFPAVQCSAVYFSLEDEADIVRYRLRQIIDTFALPRGDVVEALTVFDGSDCDATLATEVMEEGVRRLTPTVGMDRITLAAKGAGLIVIDNASDAYAGNENERRQVRAFIRMLGSLARGNDAAVLLLAHIDKAAAKYGDGGNAYSGSTAWHNSARSRLALVKDDTGAINLVHQKSNFTTEAEPVLLRFADHGVLVPMDARARDAEATRQADIDAAAVLTVLRVALTSGATITTAKRGSATAWHALCDYPELAAEYKAKGGQQRVGAALVRLERDGRIVKVPYKKPNRHDGECYKLAQTAPESAPESARATPPIPPCVTGARTECAPVPPSASVSIGAKLAQPCPRCDGEGCRYCRP
ncbi:MAG TPA: AAA family ATPase [Rhodanobacteraceae bacterium]|nr:AAA family ATPase [Rhodanobacteraceae bacterium]